MGTEYTWLKKDGVTISSYEMSNVFDLEITIDSKGKYPPNFHIFEGLTPEELLKMGKEMTKVAKYWGAEDKDG